jgi:hypothetical protein
MNTGNFKVSFDLYRDDLTNEIIIFSRSLTATPETPHFYFSSKDDKIYVVIIEGEYAIIEYCNVVSAGVHVNIKISYDTYYWKLFKNDVEVAPTSPVVTGIADDSASNSYFVNAVEPIPNTACNFLLQNLKIYSDYIPPPVTYLSLWKGEDNGNNEIAGLPLAVWTNPALALYATGKIGRAFNIASGGIITMASDPVYDFSAYATLTFEFWMKINTAGTHEMIFGISPAGMLFALYHRAPNTLSFFNFGGSGATENDLPSSIIIGDWLKIRLLYTLSTGIMSIYESPDNIVWTWLFDGNIGSPTTFSMRSGPGGGGSADGDFLIDEIALL